MDAPKAGISQAYRQFRFFVWMVGDILLMGGAVLLITSALVFFLPLVPYGSASQAFAGAWGLGTASVGLLFMRKWQGRWEIVSGLVRLALGGLLAGLAGLGLVVFLAGI